MDDKTNKLTDEDLSDAVGGVNTSGHATPLYGVGTKLQKQNDKKSFGNVINKKYENGRWVYSIMGSALRPIEVEEEKLEPKSR